MSDTKPDWDKSKEGEAPALTDRDAHIKELKRHEMILAMSPEDRLNYLDSIHREAESLANSRGADMMTPEQVFLVQWQGHASVAAASLHMFQNRDNVVENREERVAEQRRNLAVALYKLGQIESALTIAAPFPELVEHIAWIRLAIVNENDLVSHDCPRRVVGTVNFQGREIEQLADRRTMAEEVFSESHGALVKVWVCSECGEANATIESPERQQRHGQFHAAIHRDFTAGKPLTQYEALLGSD
jgi:hypothetical protein